MRLCHCNFLFMTRGGTRLPLDENACQQTGQWEELTIVCRRPLRESTDAANQTPPFRSKKKNSNKKENDSRREVRMSSGVDRSVAASERGVPAASRPSLLLLDDEAADDG